jgi:hypothetical protein
MDCIFISYDAISRPSSPTTGIKIMYSMPPNNGPTVEYVTARLIRYLRNTSVPWNGGDLQRRNVRLSALCSHITC